LIRRVDTPLYTIETLANRGDHLHAVGVARELSARLLSSIRMPTVAAELSTKSASVVVRVATELCSRYHLMEMTLPESFKVSAEVTAIMGSETGNPAIVDYLNYLPLEVGQPMHAFDRDKIDGELVIYLSEQAERVVALDGKEYTVPTGSILIRDRKKIVAVAGVIGLQNSMVTDQTRKVLVESACFDPVAVRLTARGMKISTDASYAFERGVDPESALFGLRRLAFLTQGSKGSITGLDGAHVLGITSVVGKPTEKREIVLHPKVVRKQMNLARLAVVEIVSRLKHLGYATKEGVDAKELEQAVTLSVPTWRLYDVFDEMDLVEDFVRAHGFNNVKVELPPVADEMGADSDLELVRARVETILLGNGFCEVCTDTFYPSEAVDVFARLDAGAAAQQVRIINAVEGSAAIIKYTNCKHLVEVSRSNQKKGVTSVKIFEFCRLFSRDIERNQSALSDRYGFTFEREVLSIAVAGRWFVGELRSAEQPEELLFYLKGTLEAILGSAGDTVRCVASHNPLLHPGKQAELKIGRITCGFMGALHPSLLEQFDHRGDLLYAEIDVDALLKIFNRKRESPRFSEFPSIWRDLTLRVSKKGLAGDVVHWIEELKPADCVAIQIVDDFVKPEEDFRRVSYRLIFQSVERTLASTEVDESMQMILKNLREIRGVELV
jgi:phenylalanyl-tRNA synthetase beta chain